MTAEATRDDLAAVVTALTESAAEQRRWEAKYEARALECDGDSWAVRMLWERFAAHARGAAHAFEVSADMISKYVSVGPEYTRVVNGETT